VTLRYNAAMDGKYRLVFKGEVLDGQHRAVVRRRLVEALKLSDAQAEKLFSGAAVVLKKEADATVASRYQSLFKKAGARLRVMPLEADTVTSASPAEAPTPPARRAEAPAASPAARRTDAAPAPSVAGSPRSTGSSVAGLSVVAPQELEQRLAASRSGPQEIQAPDFSVAAPGTVLGEVRNTPPPVVPDPDFSVAAVGEDLLDERVEVTPVVLGPLDFEVAEVGATIGDDKPKAAPPPPDISHIRLAEDA